MGASGTGPGQSWRARVPAPRPNVTTASRDSGAAPCGGSTVLMLVQGLRHALREAARDQRLAVAQRRVGATLGGIQKSMPRLAVGTPSMRAATSAVGV